MNKTVAPPMTEAYYHCKSSIAMDCGLGMWIQRWVIYTELAHLEDGIVHASIRRYECLTIPSIVPVSPLL